MFSSTYASAFRTSRGRPQHPQVVAIAQHGPARSERAVHGAGEARAERLHPAAERLRAVGFDDEVRVVRLDRVFDDAEIAARAKRPERVLELRDQQTSPQRRQSRTRLQCHERRMRRRDSVAAAMSHARPRPGASTRAEASTATSRESKSELSIRRIDTHYCVV
jgi:hypothetical protein